MSIQEAPPIIAEQPNENDYWDARNFDPSNIARVVGEQCDLVPAMESTGVQPEMAIVELNALDPASVLGREVERVIFGQTFGNDLELLKKEYSEYEARSSFYVALDVKNRQLAGGIRVIRDDGHETGLKSINDMAADRHPWKISLQELRKHMLAPSFDMSKTLDIGTLGAMPAYRSHNALGGITPYLYRAMYKKSEAEGLQWVGILDVPRLPGIQQLGEPLDLFEGVEAGPYLDSPASIPFYANMDRIKQRLPIADKELEEAGLKPNLMYDFFVRGLDENGQTIDQGFTFKK